MTSEKKQEYALKISKANKTGLIVILYEMLLDYMKEAEDAIADNHLDSFHAGIRRAQGCNQEMINSLNMEYEIAGNLYQLYRYANRQFARADIRISAKPLESVQHIIRELLEAYREVNKQDTSPAVMENIQTVYAGLTYGKNNLVESLSDEGIDRGFRA